MSTNTSDTYDSRNDHLVVHINNIGANTEKSTYDPSIVFDLIHAQKNDVFYRKRATQEGRANSEFSINSNGLFIQQSSVDGVIQVVTALSLRPRILMLLHQPQLAGNPGQQRMYDTLQCNFY